MKLSDIKIAKSFASTTPGEKKMAECRNHYLSTGKQDRDIVVSHKGVLVDGYIQYLILKEFGVEDAEVKISNARIKHRRRRNHTADDYSNKPTTYVFGRHITDDGESEREYVWRVPQLWSEQGFDDELKVGDKLLVHANRSLAPIIITRIERLDKPPVDFKVKKVAYKTKGKII
jgi:hypothetical protein